MIQKIKCFFGFHGRIVDCVVYEAAEHGFVPQDRIEDVIMPCCLACGHIFTELS